MTPFQAALARIAGNIRRHHPRDCVCGAPMCSGTEARRVLPVEVWIDQVLNREA